jgi:hypothetical protein
VIPPTAPVANAVINTSKIGQCVTAIRVNDNKHENNKQDADDLLVRARGKGDEDEDEDEDEDDDKVGTRRVCSG